MKEYCKKCDVSLKKAIQLDKHGKCLTCNEYLQIPGISPLKEEVIFVKEFIKQLSTN